MIIKHELKMNSKMFLIWTFIIAAMNFCFMLMYPSMEEALNTAMDAYKNMGAFTAAFGMDRLNMAEPIGFYGSYVGAILSLGGAMFAAMLGTGILSKEEAGHTSEFLYTLPYQRANVVLQKVAAVFILIFAFDFINLSFGLLSFPLINETLELKKMLLYHAAQFFMHFEIAAIGICISALTSKINLGMGLGMALMLYFLDMMARILEKLEPVKYITPYYYANAADVFTSFSIDAKLLIIGLFITVISVLFGTWYYCRRDLAS